MSRQKPVFRHAIHYLLLFMLALLFATFFHFLISPIITEATDIDVSCFQIIGKAMTAGQMPYLNFIDNKGPVLYFIYMISSLLLPFPWGIFFFSVILDFVSFIILEKICNRLKITHSFYIILLYLFFYICICSNGGLTEDISLPLTLAAFLIYLDFDESLKQNKFHCSHGFLLSLLFWVCAFTRFNNALSIGLIVASVAIQLLLTKRFQYLIRFIASFAAGSILIVLPIVFWLLRNGALQEFFHQFLFMNFQYAQAEDAVSKVDLFFRNRFGFALLVLLLESFLGAYMFYRRRGKENRSIFITTLVVLFGTALSFVSMTKPIIHYLLVILVPAFFGFILQYAYLDRAPQPIGKNRVFIIITTVLCCIGLVLGGAGNFTVKVGVFFIKTVSSAIIHDDLTQKTEYEQEIERLAERIPKQERNSVYSLNANPKFFVYSDITPCKRMFVCQSLFTDISEDYAAEFITYFSVAPPSWLITEEPLSAVDLCEAENAIIDRYQLVDHSAGYYLYQRSNAK